MVGHDLKNGWENYHNKNSEAPSSYIFQITSIPKAIFMWQPLMEWWELRRKNKSLTDVSPDSENRFHANSCLRRPDEYMPAGESVWKELDIINAHIKEYEKYYSKHSENTSKKWMHWAPSK